mmetsp:Transcript_8530/g.31514  ORF Transcript_8530/g.31514 Transcript_8530/m.31514 type:complete len:320 (-) Transcript_8530:601-1560(-)
MLLRAQWVERHGALPEGALDAGTCPLLAQAAHEAPPLLADPVDVLNGLHGFQVGDKGLRNPLRAEQVRPLQARVKRGDGRQVISHCGGRSRCGCGSWGCWLRLCLRLLLCCCGSGWWWLRQSLQLFPLPLRLCWLLLLLLLKHALAGVESGHGGVVAAEAGPSNGLEGAPLHTAEDAALGFVAHRTGVTVPFPRRDLLHAVAHLVNGDVAALAVEDDVLLGGLPLAADMAELRLWLLDGADHRRQRWQARRLYALALALGTRASGEHLALACRLLLRPKRLHAQQLRGVLILPHLLVVAAAGRHEEDLLLRELRAARQH